MANARRQKKNILDKARWAGYAAAGAAAFGAGEVADAAIVHSGVLNIDLAGAAGNIDLDGDGVNDIFLSNPVNSATTIGGGSYPVAGAGFVAQGNNIVGTGTTATTVANSNAGIAGFTGAFGYPYAYNIPVGAAIDGALSFLPAGTLAFVSYANNGGSSQFAVQGQQGIIGVEFDIGGNTHYGWIRVENRTGVPTHLFTLVDFAYEDQPNTAINAGAIPEPGSLGLLALGATGLLGWRRRRSA